MESLYAIAVFALLLFVIVLLLALVDSQRRGDSWRDAFANECARHDKTRAALERADAKSLWETW